MKIAIIGRTEALYNTAKLLYETAHEISLVITSKAAEEYTKNEEDFEKFAKEVGAKFIYTSKINSKEVTSIIKELLPIDIGISMNYTQVISGEVIEMFRLGILNSHSGDLPRYRGNACLAWAILNAEDKVAHCIHKMCADELDSGDIIQREYFDIDINTKVGTCNEWAIKITPKLFLNAVQKLCEDENFILEKQSTKKEDILRCYPRCQEDGKIDWKLSNKEILRLINASNKPYAGAYCKYLDKKMIIWDAELYDDGQNYCATCGQVSKINYEDCSVEVITGDKKLKINLIEYDNKVQKPSKVIKNIRDRLKNI